jgi:hypothetical protein
VGRGCQRLEWRRHLWPRDHDAKSSNGQDHAAHKYEDGQPFHHAALSYFAPNAKQEAHTPPSRRAGWGGVVWLQRFGWNRGARVGKKNQGSSKLRDLSKEMPNAEELHGIVSNIDTADARACVLVLAAFVDGLLARVIHINFVDMDKAKFNGIFRDVTAPLQSFSAKIILAHALGIIDDQFKSQLDKFRAIRNAFAHAVKLVDFDDPIVAAECNKLNPQLLMRDEYQPETDSPRERFTAVGTFIGLHLTEYFRFRVAELNSAKRPTPFRGKHG